MREILLDGRNMHTKSEMHDVLIERLSLPYYYGRSLDSLFNILSKEMDPIQITVIHPEMIAIGYGDVLIELLQDLMKHNKNYHIEIVQEA